MKKIKCILLILVSFFGFCQNNFVAEYEKAMNCIQKNEIDLAYTKFTELEKTVPKSDTLYEHTLWNKVSLSTYLEGVYRSQEKFDESLKYGLDALDGILKGKILFDDNFAKREYFMVKNIIVSNYGLGNFEEGKKWKEKMYKAKKDNSLPEGIDEYFNYDFFKLEGKNVWGYEWFSELPKDRFSTSFTKIVYYVYSTNEDGSDKDQLYRLHVLMFHGNNQNFDYVLDKKLETATEEIGGTLYAYTYKEIIDFEKLKNDVKEVVKGNLKPDTKRTASKGADGKVKVDVELNNK